MPRRLGELKALVAQLMVTTQLGCHRPEQVAQGSKSVQMRVEVFKEMKKEVDMRQLFEVSTLEQNLACREEHDTAKAEVREAVAKASTPESRQDALRLVMLYNLRYERSSSCITDELVTQLVSQRLRADDAAMVKKVIAYGGRDARTGPGAGLFNNENTANKLMSMMAAQSSMVFGDSNVSDLIQHTPLVGKVIKDLSEGKLGGDYPEINQPAEGRPKEIILFIVGGTTYAEAACVAEWNEANPGCRVMLGGTHIHNSSSFMEEVDSFAR